MSPFLSPTTSCCASRTGCVSQTVPRFKHLCCRVQNLTCSVRTSTKAWSLGYTSQGTPASPQARSRTPYPWRIPASPSSPPSPAVDQLQVPDHLPCPAWPRLLLPLALAVCTQISTRPPPRPSPSACIPCIRRSRKPRRLVKFWLPQASAPHLLPASCQADRKGSGGTRAEESL